jgi:putative ABC transport system permease protein
MMTEKYPFEQKSDAGKGSVKRLVVLPFLKSVEISFKSIKARFFRSMITTLSLVLAVSFLSFVYISNDAANGLLAADDLDLRQRLIQSGYDLAPGADRVDSSPKQRWIAILSLLVCAVGIVNAQLMAVTERFREIGTMKCLGALDRFILRLFMLEAGMQGLAGAAVGALAGGLFALLNAWFMFGAAAWAHLPWAVVTGSVIKAIGVGCVLSLIGVLYPAVLAARMQPVEAMRAEH